MRKKDLTIQPKIQAIRRSELRDINGTQHGAGLGN